MVALNFTSRLWSLPKSYPFCVELHLLCFDPLCDFIIALIVRVVNSFFKVRGKLWCRYTLLRESTLGLFSEVLWSSPCQAIPSPLTVLTNLCYIVIIKQYINYVNSFYIKIKSSTYFLSSPLSIGIFISNVHSESFFSSSIISPPTINYQFFIRKYIKFFNYFLF